MTPPASAPRRLAEGIKRAAVSRSWPGSPRQEHLALAAVSVLIALLTWPVTDYLPANGLDPSWIAGLHMAADGAGPAGGEPLVFTYGPLGFLLVPQLWVGWTFILAFVVAGAIHLAVVAALLVGARRSFPWLPATVIVFVLAMIAGGGAGVASSRAFVLAVLVALWVALSTWRGRWAWGAPIITGVLCGTFMLANLGMGLGATALMAIASVGAVTVRRWAPPLIHLGSAVAALVLVWVIAVGDLTALPSWFRNSLDIILGYPAAMTWQAPSTDWYWFFLAVMFSAIAAEVIWFARRVSPWRWAPLLAVVVLALYLLTQKHMVRSGEGHMLLLIFALGGIAVSIPVRQDKLAVPALAAAFSVLGYWVALPMGLMEPIKLSPVPRVQALVDQARAVVSPSRRGQLLAEGQARLATAYGLSPAVQRAIANKPVVVDPFEIGAAWAYSLRWEPVPVLQPYSAYTRRLDELNAETIATGRAQRVLMQVKPFNAEYAGLGLDGRRLDADSPAYNLAIVCNFVPIARDERWVALERVPSRCGDPRPLGAPISAVPGAPVPVPVAPRRDAVVYARIDAELPVKGKLTARLWVPRWVPQIILDNGLINRFVLATGSSTWLMRVPEPLAQSLHDPAASQVSQFVVNDVASPYSVRFFWLPVVSGGGAGRPWASPAGGA